MEAEDRTDKQPTARFTCANFDGDAYTGHHTGPCGSPGYVDVPVELAATGDWRRWVIDPANTRGEGWSVTTHYCRDAGDHDVNAGSRVHDNQHEMLFCCGPCMLSYLLSMYFRPMEVAIVLDMVMEAIAP